MSDGRGEVSDSHLGEVHFFILHVFGQAELGSDFLGDVPFPQESLQLVLARGFSRDDILDGLLELL